MSGNRRVGGFYHAIIRSGFTTERHWFFGDALVDNAVGEHGLAGDSEDEGSE